MPLPVEVYVPVSVIVSQGRLYRSRLRWFVWENLRKLYDDFDFNRDGKLQLEEIKVLISSILHLRSTLDI